MGPTDGALVPGACLWESLDDSPFLKNRLQKLTAECDAFNVMSSKLTKGGRKYRDSIDDAYVAEINLAESIKAFCGSANGTATDEPSLEPHALTDNVVSTPSGVLSGGGGDGGGGGGGCGM